MARAFNQGTAPIGQFARAENTPPFRPRPPGYFDGCPAKTVLRRGTAPIEKSLGASAPGPRDITGNVQLYWPGETRIKPRSDGAPLGGLGGGVKGDRYLALANQPSDNKHSIEAESMNRNTNLILFAIATIGLFLVLYFVTGTFTPKSGPAMIWFHSGLLALVIARLRGQSLTGDSDLDSRLAFGGSLGRADWCYRRRMGSDRTAVAA